jgi:histone-lysine N-methyltransferase SUV39H
VAEFMPLIYGNVARMLNHSCEPNVTTLEITVARAPVSKDEEETDPTPKVPRVGFFTMRDIQADEELCIDYSPGQGGC